MRPTSVAPFPALGAGGSAGTSGAPRCAVCAQVSLPGLSRRFGGRRVCAECWSGLARLERSRPFRGLPRSSLLAHFKAEVAVRQAWAFDRAAV